ncbi:UNVERIFIED_CONTAM: hypothetical protein RMT77_008457 [Armadillidium vulgare]
MKIIGKLHRFVTTPLIYCLTFLLHKSYLMKWSRPLTIVVLLIPFSLFMMFGILDEKTMPKHIRTPTPYSVNSLYPSRVPLLDLRHFTYIINNDVCQEKKVFAIVIVHSHPANMERRDAMRKNIPAEDLFEIGVRRVFLLARAEWDDQTLYKKTPQDQIDMENVLHRDIIQGNFKEHYHNLTYKHVMGLQWVNTYCSQVTYIIKMDDDIIVDIYHFRDILKYRYNDRKNIILGLLEVEARPIRSPKSKWYVSKAEYPGDVYPNFVSGWAYAMSSDAAVKIVNSSRKFRYFWIDDLFITGTIAEAAEVKREGLNRLYTTHVYHMQCCVELPKHSDYLCDYIAGPSEGDVQLMEQLLSHARNCYVQPCSKRPPEFRISKMCIVTNNPNALEMGKGRGEVIKIN